MREITKCVAWNAARYDQIYDYELAVKLLLEETTELSEASSVVDMLDAIGDITFVAVGIMWKMGMTVEDLEAVFYNKDIDITKLDTQQAYNYSMFIVNTLIERNPHCNVSIVLPGISLAAFSIFITALTTLRGLGMQDSFFDVFDAICDSNNTKEVKGKSNPSIKANIVKGEGFVPPTKRLREIEASYNAIVKEAI